LGFALAGLVLVYKRIGGALQLLWQMLVFFTGALAPIEHPLLGPLRSFAAHLGDHLPAGDPHRWGDGAAVGKWLAASAC
jgi:hypothetical protein